MQTENIKKGWKKVKIGDVLDILTDYHANGSYEKLKENVVLLDKKDYAIMIRTTNFEQHNFENLIYINEHAYNHLYKSKVYEGDIVMNKIANPGSIYLVPNLGCPVSLAMNLFLLRFSNSVSQRFMYYSLKFYEDYIKTFANGTATKTIRKDVVRNIEITIPESIENQQKIASILSKYDDLIENNSKRIKILEQTAQEIYKEWFVNFRFPGYENVNMVDSGIEFGKIPEGWEIKSILDIIYFRFINENIKKFEGEKIYYATADLDGINISGKGVIVDYKNKPSRAQKQPIENSVWFARMQETFKVLGFTSINRDIVERSILSSGMVGFNCDELIFPFLFFTINSKNFYKLKDMYCTGATQRALTNDGLRQIKIVNPNIEIVKLFGEKTLGLVNEIFILQKQNQNLKQTRDMLIPKLVSGEIEVDSLDVKF